MENRQLNFDVARGGVQHRLSVCVGDTKSRTVTARFFSGSEPVTLTAAYLRGLRADGVQIYAACTVVDGAATYTFTTSDLSVGGTLMCEFDLHNGDAVMTSPRFVVLCGKPLYTGEGAEGSNEYAAYIAALLKLENLTVTAETGEAAAATATVGDTAVQLHFVLPKGDKGEKGDKGDTGAQGDPGKDGAPGAPGSDGVNGLTPFIGANGNWWIGDTDTGISALGIKGDKGDKGEKGDKGADSDVTAAGDNTFTGSNTFTGAVIVPAPTADPQAANKAYVDSFVNTKVAEMVIANVVQTTGQSTTAVMSQKATTDEINALKSDITDLQNALIGVSDLIGGDA